VTEDKEVILFSSSVSFTRKERPAVRVGVVEQRDLYPHVHQVAGVQPHQVMYRIRSMRHLALPSLERGRGLSTGSRRGA